MRGVYCVMKPKEEKAAIQLLKGFFLWMVLIQSGKDRSLII